MAINCVARVLAGASTVALGLSLTQVAHAQGGAVPAGVTAEEYTGIVVSDGIDLDALPPGGAYDSTVDVTGVGQMVVHPDPSSFSVGLCTGTLINPRTVLFAAHCVNDIPADSYGSASGGTPMSFGFSADNLPAVREWIGLGASTPYQTHEDLNIFNVEQVWYDTRSLATDFLEGDVALATLDTHAGGVPTWTMLFSPLTEETHAIINGYGGRGTGANGDTLGIDFRRRIAENTISVLGSLEDRNDWLFGPGDYGLPQNLYMLDFDSPGGEASFGVTTYDFDIFDGGALPAEGTTAGGDSGGPLIADEAFDIPVVVATLSGGSRFFAAQPFSSYGTHSFYQPLFLFWESIVANNSYAYASALPGTANWMNPTHWIQDMDPNYVIASGGVLENALPGFAEPGISGETPQFGSICFLTDCYDIAPDGVPLVDGGANSIFVPGGPGSLSFVPDNVVADPSAGIRARYYEVTLASAGTTILADPITIDRLNIEGAATLDIRPDGDLFVWGDYTQTGGWLELDGSLRTGEAFLGTGIISGNGLFDPTYLTNVAGLIAPGEHGKPGTLTIAGDVILSSAAVTVFDLHKSGGDLLAIIGDGDNSGIAALGGTAVLALGTGGQKPRYGQNFTILTAEGGVVDTFDDVVSVGSGVLYSVLSYNPASVVADIDAVPFTTFLSAGGVTNPYALAFGNAFDQLRASNYADLSGVFGVVDLLPASELAFTIGANAAAVAGELSQTDQRQGTEIRQLVSGRLSLLGRTASQGGTFRLHGSPEVLNLAAGYSGSAASQLSFARSYQPRDWQGFGLPEQFSGFMSAGYQRSADIGADDSQSGESGSWHIAMGLEYAVDDRNSIGSAVGYSRGDQVISGARAAIATSQAAFYASHRLGRGFYLGGQADIAYSRIDAASRLGHAGARFDVDSSATGLNGTVELGYNAEMDGLTLTPRASIGYTSYSVRGFTDPTSQLGLAVDGLSRSGIDLRTGLRIAGRRSLGLVGTWSFQPEVQVDYVQRLSGKDTRIDVHFLEAAGLGISLPVSLHDADYGEIRGGLQLADGEISIGTAVEARIGQQSYRDERAVVNVGLRF